MNNANLSETKVSIKVAFDVMGTLIGPHQDNVLQLYRSLEAIGCVMIVWSAYDIEKIRELIAPLGITPHYIFKKVSPEVYPDICVDDSEDFVMSCRERGIKPILVK